MREKFSILVGCFRGLKFSVWVRVIEGGEGIEVMVKRLGVKWGGGIWIFFIKSESYGEIIEEF